VLAIEVSLLRGGYFANNEEGGPEYPPPVYRLFAACLEVCETRGWETHLETLRVLETLGDPVIHTGHPFPDGPRNTHNQCARYVSIAPKEDWNFDPKDKIIWSATYVTEPRVVYCWPSAFLTPQDYQNLTEIVREVHHLGRGESLVSVSLVETWDPSGLTLRYVPDPLVGRLMFKTIRSGLLDSLKSSYEQGEYFNLAPRVRYSQVTQHTALSAFWDEVIPFKVRTRLSVSDTLPFLEAVRSRILSFNEEGIPTPAVFHGHGWTEGPSHTALIPLANVGFPHSDGEIKGFAVCLPKQTSEGNKMDIRHALNVLLSKGFYYRGEHLQVELPTRPIQALQEDRWCAPSEKWVSVTPVVLPKIPKRNKLSLERIVEEMCAHSGLPTPTSVEYGTPNFMTGVPFSKNFRVRRKGSNPLHWGHMRLSFAQPVQGPVLLGSLRHFGLGLFSPET
jgi:CRISPR-associated protein Csb2